ncbi:MAG: Metal-dependent hydrolase [Frankiales bacterium]|nr:Metal-dependent hydrolase [Frankiales bacterium]
MRVVTWNLHAGIGLDGRYDLGRIADVLRPLDADVVGLQEVDVRYSARSQHADMAADLAALLDRRVVFAPALTSSTGAYGLALLTREPVRSSRVHLLPSSTDAPYGEQRVCLEADVQRGADGLQVLVTHLQHRPPGDRDAQWEAVRALVRRPGVVLGDLNEEVAPLARRALLVDAGRPAGTTFRSDRPRRRIDAVLLTPDLSASRAQRLRSDASDHLPVVVDLQSPAGS